MVILWATIIAFPVVEHYVRNAWKKYGTIRARINSKGLLFFKFSLGEVWTKCYRMDHGLFDPILLF